MDRRELLKRGSVVAAGAVLGVQPALTNRPAYAVDPTLGSFAHGVASGDPLTDRVVLWTRLTTERERAEVGWRVATDPALRNVVRRGTASAERDRDWTVKVDADGLAAGRTYYYGFTDAATGLHSLTGRTRTAPAGRTDRLRIALARRCRCGERRLQAAAAVRLRS